MSFGQNLDFCTICGQAPCLCPICHGKGLLRGPGPMGTTVNCSCRPEAWRAVPGYEGRYEVSDGGRVRSLRSTVIRVLRGGRCKGYSQVALWRDGQRRMRFVHQLVLEAFTGTRPPGHEAAHLNGRSFDNRLGNLAWVTHTENVRHMAIHGTKVTGARHYMRTRPEIVRRGEKAPAAKLTESQVLGIVTAGDSGESQRAIARRYGVGQTSIRDILLGYSWGHVTGRNVDSDRPCVCPLRVEEDRAPVRQPRRSGADRVSP
jgi:hypothetical protein